MGSEPFSKLIPSASASLPMDAPSRSGIGSDGQRADIVEVAQKMDESEIVATAEAGLRRRLESVMSNAIDIAESRAMVPERIQVEIKQKMEEQLSKLLMEKDFLNLVSLLGKTEIWSRTLRPN